MTANAGESAPVVLTAALEYISRGLSPIPIPHRKKGPLIDAWQDLRVTADTALAYFNGARQNIGIILGLASGGLTDLDLDCPEAIAAAPYILPRTAIFGRATKPASHWVYRTNLHKTKDRAAIKFMGSDKTGLIEVRMGAGGLASQTVFPPSTHVSGEPIEWAGRGASEIAEVDGDELIQRARRLAAASELARSYPKIGGRHDAAFMLGGFLARCGFSPPLAATFVEAVAAASLQPGDKRRDMARTARDGAAARKPAGFPLLAETFGEGAAKKVAEWLGYAGESEGRGVRAAKGVDNPDPGPDSGPDPADAELERLAKLSPLKYERERKAAAEALGLRASLLDRLVVAKRTELGLDGDDGKQGQAIEFPEPEPWPNSGRRRAAHRRHRRRDRPPRHHERPSMRRRRPMGRPCLPARPAEDLAAARHPVGGQRFGQNHAARRPRAARPAAAFGRQCEPVRHLPRHRRPCADAVDR